MIYTLAFVTLDWIISKMIINPYFFLHSLLNIITSIGVVLDDKKPNLLFIVIIEFHLYHMISYWKTLSIKDLVHHVCTILVLIICYLDKKDDGEFEMRFALFAMCGFPDAIDFAALTFHKNKIINKSKCLDICHAMNIYCRMPLCILSSIVTSAYSLKTNIHHHYYFGIIFAFITICNGIFFALDVHVLRFEFNLKMSN